MTDIQFPTQREPTLLLMITLFLIGAAAFINVYSIQAILPIVQRDMQLNASQVGATVGATTLAVALISPFIGMLSDAIGRRNLIIASIFFLSVPTALIYCAHSFNSMFIFRFLQGLVVPGIAVVTMAYIGEEFRGASMAKMMSAYVSGTVFGGFMGRFLIGHFSEYMPWREAYILLATTNLIASIGVFALLPHSQNFVPNRKISHAFSVLLDHLHRSEIHAACLMGCCLLFSLVGCFTYINLYLSEQPFLLSTGALANIFTVYLIGMIATPIGGKIIAKKGVRTTAIGALILSSTGLAFTLTSSLSTIIIALALTASGIFITQASAVSFIASKVNEGRSLATGLYNMAYYFGGFAGSFVCGIAYTYGHWIFTVATLIGAQMIAALIAWKLMK